MQAEKTLIYSHDIILPLIPPNHLKFCHLFQYIINMLYYYYNIIIFLSYFSCSWILTFLSIFSFPGRESPSDVLFQPAGMKSVSSTQDSSSISSHPKLPEAQDIKSSANPRPHGLKTFKAVEMSLEIQKLSKWLKNLIRQYTTWHLRPRPQKADSVKQATHLSRPATHLLLIKLVTHWQATNQQGQC